MLAHALEPDDDETRLAALMLQWQEELRLTTLGLHLLTDLIDAQASGSENKIRRLRRRLDNC
jgi:hypothetical protein